ncbi:MAG: ABC transporter ATP-binding protein [Bdellovibrionaceae bacterium]|nr:ABC transporter ATP-binding protein [Pseudobdellovibrionaceae bacterium]
MAPPLKVQNLVKNYNKVQAVKNVSFELQPGEIFGLLGPNGAGKTSIISCIVTLETPNEGLIEVFGHDVTQQAKAAKYKMGFVPQELIHHGFFSAEEILEIHSGYYCIVNNRERIHYLLNELGLWEHKDKKVRQLSGGMKRRLLVAKALVHEPRLLLLDEPTAGVDIELRESLWKFVCELKKEGVSVLLTTHYLEEAEELCQRVGVLSHGRLIKLGETHDLITELTHRRVSFSLKNSLKKIHHELKTEELNNRHIFNIPYTKSIEELFNELSLGLGDVTDLKIQEGSLEDAFRYLLVEDMEENK